MKYQSLAALLMLCACVSTEMKSYVGKPIEEAFIAYGPPENSFVFPDGRRAYQFRWGGGTYVQPSNSTATASTFGNVTTVNATTTPAMVLNSPGCLITFIAADSGAGLVIQDYRYPKQLTC